MILCLATINIKMSYPANLFIQLYFQIFGNTNNFYFYLYVRFCKRIFESNYKATIGVDFEVERFDVLGIPYNLQM